jgi:hypothetical protein
MVSAHRRDIAKRTYIVDTERRRLRTTEFQFGRMQFVQFVTITFDFVGQLRQ